MEFEIGLKLKVSIRDLETNVNEIVRAVKEGIRDAGREVLREVLGNEERGQGQDSRKRDITEPLHPLLSQVS